MAEYWVALNAKMIRKSKYRVHGFINDQESGETFFEAYATDDSSSLIQAMLESLDELGRQDLRKGELDPIYFVTNNRTRKIVPPGHLTVLRYGACYWSSRVLFQYKLKHSESDLKMGGLKLV